MYTAGEHRAVVTSESGSTAGWVLLPSILYICLSKVADCICLMALDKPQAVPVDVHMWQIAQHDYSWHPSMSWAKGPSPKANKELGEKGRAGH